MGVLGIEGMCGVPMLVMPPPTQRHVVMANAAQLHSGHRSDNTAGTNYCHDLILNCCNDFHNIKVNSEKGSDLL